MHRIAALLLLVALFAAACMASPPMTPIPVNSATPVATLTMTAVPDSATREEATEVASEATTQVSADSPHNPYEVTIWTLNGGYGDQKTLLANADVVNEINPFWYTLNAKGGIDGVARDADMLELLRARGIRIIPTIANEFDRQRVHDIIGNPEARTEHVQTLVSLVLDNDFDGIDVDYESLYKVDREDFTAFIEELADALHAEGKLLSIAVHPKTNESGDWEGPQAQDYPRLGAAADLFKIMTYDYSWSTSPAGPISPVDWAVDVVRYATSVIPPEKIYLGVHFYGYDWIGSTGEPKVYDQIQMLMQRNAPLVERDASNEGYFSYGGSHPRTVYFADALSVQTKLDAVFNEFPELAGVAIWRLGGEDPAIWDVLRTWAVGSADE